MWIPYVLNSFLVRGIMGTLANPLPDAKPLASWAVRAKQAHANAVENLVPFAALVLVGHLLDVPGVAAAAMVYFYARLCHYVIYSIGIPVARTLSFLVGWGAMAIIALHILKSV